jgi:hypothetical protein
MKRKTVVCWNRQIRLYLRIPLTKLRLAIVDVLIGAICVHSSMVWSQDISSYFIMPKPIPIEPQLKKLGKLPKDARGVFPAFDGDSFFVSLRPQKADKLMAENTFKDFVAPVVSAFGFDPKLLSIPAGAVKLSKPNLADLASQVCLEVDAKGFERYQAVCDAMQHGKITENAERIFQNGDGMSFAQFKDDIERERIQFLFRQVIDGVPIEHAGVLAEGWQGESITTVRGTVFSKFGITNKKLLNSSDALTIGEKNLLTLSKGITQIDSTGQKLHTSPQLVLLPYGAFTSGNEKPMAGLRYAFRTLLFALAKKDESKNVERVSWLAWIDAENGKILELVPQFSEATNAQGKVWRRDPGITGGTSVRSFEVDNPTAGQCLLQLDGVLNRIDRLLDTSGGSFSEDEVTIPSATSAPACNFTVTNIGNDTTAICESGLQSGNTRFRQVNTFAHLYRYWKLVTSAGTIPTFPEAGVTVWMDYSVEGVNRNSANYDVFGDGLSRLLFVNGSGFESSMCPNATNASLNGAQDTTAIAHEFAHLSTKRLQDRRPLSWCNAGECPLPIGRVLFHDFADAWANAYSSTPCISGWTNKNNTGPGASEHCKANTSEGGDLPRVALADEVRPFPVASVTDRFPGHRLLGTGDYADGQIVAAALWLVRQGMRSKCLPSGTAQYWVRLNRALWNFGFLSPTCSGCDRDIYRYAQDLMRAMIDQWATAGQPDGPPAFRHNGAHTTNKVLSGWARAGIFLTPYQCIDGDPSTVDPSFCAGGEDGADAIVDVNDNDTSDDVEIDGVGHQEVDYLKRNHIPPTFRVWTGTPFTFSTLGGASPSSPAPCNAQFQVELTSDDSFTTNVLKSTQAGGSWLTVPTTGATACYGTWTPNPADATWQLLIGSSGEKKIFYRVKTQNNSATNDRISTQPGNGMFVVPPAYVIVSESGTP